MVLVGVSSRKSIWSNASIVFLSVTKTLHNVVLSDRILQQQLFYLLSQRWTRQTKNERLHEFDLSAQCFLAPLTAFRLAHSALIPLVPHTSQIYSIYIFFKKHNWFPETFGHCSFYQTFLKQKDRVQYATESTSSPQAYWIILNICLVCTAGGKALESHREVHTERVCTDRPRAGNHSHTSLIAQVQLSYYH